MAMRKLCLFEVVPVAASLFPRRSNPNLFILSHHITPFCVCYLWLTNIFLICKARRDKKRRQSWLGDQYISDPFSLLDVGTLYYHSVCPFLYTL